MLTPSTGQQSPWLRPPQLEGHMLMVVKPFSLLRGELMWWLSCCGLVRLPSANKLPCESQGVNCTASRPQWPQPSITCLVLLVLVSFRWTVTQLIFRWVCSMFRQARNLRNRLFSSGFRDREKREWACCICCASVAKLGIFTFF